MAKEVYAQVGGAPKALFTAALTLLEGALNFIKEEHGHIPADMHIGTYDDHPFLDYMSVKICSVRQDTHRIARVATGMIFDALSGQRVIQQKIINPFMVIRN
jgi:DNA-binding LacI/PurR family transcriptional regulator